MSEGGVTSAENTATIVWFVFKFVKVYELTGEIVTPSTINEDNVDEEFGVIMKTAFEPDAKVDPPNGLIVPKPEPEILELIVNVSGATTFTVLVLVL